jgi:hypothetical protein
MCPVRSVTYVSGRSLFLSGNRALAPPMPSNHCRSVLLPKYTYTRRFPLARDVERFPAGAPMRKDQRLHHRCSAARPPAQKRQGLRSVLVVGATTVIQHTQRGGRPSPWLSELLKTQVAEVGRGGPGQQDGAHRLETDGHRGELRRNSCAHGVGRRRLEISHTRGATQLQPC